MHIIGITITITISTLEINKKNQHGLTINEQANVSTVEYQRMMNVYKRAVRQTDQIRFLLLSDQNNLGRPPSRLLTLAGTIIVVEDLALNSDAGN